MKVLEAGPPPREERPAPKILHDEPNVRIIAFPLLPGQVIPPHRNDSTVIVTVTEGSGTFVGEDGESELRVGESAVYAPGEAHSIRAGAETLRFNALLAPRPHRWEPPGQGR